MKDDGFDQYNKQEAFAEISKAYMKEKSANMVRGDESFPGGQDRTIRLDSVLKSQFERAFGVDLENVRIHMGPYSDELTRRVNADAVTIGNDIYFHEGKYAPDTEEGQSLLAHELRHFVHFKEDKRMVYIEDIAEIEDEATATEMMMGVLNLHHVTKPYLKEERAGELAREDDKHVKSGTAGQTREPPASMKEFGKRRNGSLYRIYFPGSGRVYTLTKEEREQAIERAVQRYKKFLEDETVLLPEEEREKFLLKHLAFLSGR